MRRTSVFVAIVVVAAVLQVGPVLGQDNGAGVFLRVVDGAGSPLEGVQIRWTDGGPLQVFDWAWTDEDGKAFIYDEGDIAVRFEPPGEDGAAVWLGGAAGRAGSETLSLRDQQWLEEQTVVLPEGGSIGGTARLVDGTPVPWTCGLVRTPSGDLVTRGWGDADGRWSTREIVPAGEYVVEFQHCGSTTTWGWHGGDSLATATRVTVAADAATTGIDANLDPAARPSDELAGRPTSDAEVLAQHDLLNTFRRQMGLRVLQLDWTQVEANRLHARYTVATSTQEHDEDRSSPWHTEEGYLGAVTSGLGGPEIVRDLSQAPFHWFNALNPYSRWAGNGGWLGDSGRAGGLHIRPDSPEERPAAADDVDWPIVWPADGSVAPGRNHTGEFPPPAGACGWHDPAPFIEFGFPLMVQLDHHGPQVNVTSHEVRVAGTVVESCAMTASSYDNPHDTDPALSIGRMRDNNTVIVLPREPLPPAATVEVSLTTDQGVIEWSFTAPVDAVEFGPGLRADPGGVTLVAQQDSARQAAIAMAGQLFDRHPWGHTVSPYHQVVLCREDVFADCLAVTPLLSGGTALLFTEGGPSGILPPEVEAEVVRLRALIPEEDVPIRVIGGSNAISEAQVTRLRELGATVERLQGAGRVETAIAIASSTLYQAPARVLLARDGDWADAITVGAFAAATTTPVLLNPTDSLHPAVADWLAGLPGVEVVVLGGTGAISDTVLQQLRDRGHPVRRVAGPSRVETAVAIAEQVWGRTAVQLGDAVAMVDTFAADGWQPTLLAAQLASRHPTVLLSGTGDALHPAVSAYLDRAVTATTPGLVSGPTTTGLAGPLRDRLG